MCMLYLMFIDFKYVIIKLTCNIFMQHTITTYYSDLINIHYHQQSTIVPISYLIDACLQYSNIYQTQIYLMSANMEQFKQQTFALIKQQATKIKSHAKELEIKEEQIRLLKETITSLEDENQHITQNKTVLATKIQLIMEEVNNYNNNIVKKLHNDNQMLTAKVDDLTVSLADSLESVKRLTQQLQASEDNCKKYSSEAHKLKEASTQGNKQLTKIKSEHGKYKDLAGEQQKKINKLEAVNEQFEDKLKWQEKQIDNLVNKLQQTANSYEKKIKNLKDNLVKKEQITKIQQQSIKSAKKAEDFKKQLDKLSRQKNQLQLNMKILKEKDISTQMRIQVEDATIQADLRNLKDSCKIGKKINDFECKYFAVLNQIEEEFRSVRSARDEATCKNQLLTDRINHLEKQLSLKQTQLEQQQHELQLMSQKLKSEAACIQSSYEGKILQLSMKIKKQEKALQQLGVKDKQFSNLSEQYEKLAQQHIEMKDSLENTITQYKKENAKLSNQVQELIQLCDENINTRNSLNSLKHTINNLLAVIYFLHLNLVRNRQARRKIWQPFIEFYFNVKSSIQKGAKGRKRMLRKFRSAVLVLMAIKRMQKGAKQTQGAGIFRYVDKAIKTKGKIEQLNEYLQNLLEKAIKSEKNTPELLKQNKGVYKWNSLHNYQKINIPINWYANKLEQTLSRQ